MKLKLLAVSPTPECLYLAARIRQSWRTLAITGAKLIQTRLAEWIETQPGASVVVVLADVADPSGTHHLLQRFTAGGGSILWFAREDSGSVIKACSGIERVKLYTGATLEEAVGKLFIPPAVAPGFESSELQDFLRYKINLFFMRGMADNSILLEAVETLAGCRSKSFSLEKHAKADCESVRHFQDTDFPYIEGQSAPVMAIKRRLLELAPTPMSVLIVGETGTGKEACAFYLHEFSERRSGPFVSINCAGLDENHLRSELFGHKAGAFTGAIAERKGLVEQASGGTIFFDELTDMPLAIQADLLRFIQTRRFRPLGSDEEHGSDVRLVAAAQPNMYEMLESGDFRPDLYYRIAEVELKTPRLAAVPEDIRRIIRNIAYHCRNNQIEDRIRETLEYFNTGESILRDYSWPGNVRELARYVRRRLFVGDDVLTEIARLGSMPPSNGRHPVFKPIHGPSDLEPAREITRRYVRHAWSQRGQMTQQELARGLDISVNTLKSLLK